MKSLNKRQASEIIYKLRGIRQVSKMENCHFRPPYQSQEKGEELTKTIVETTKLWRESWITGPLDEVIGEFEQIYFQGDRP